MLRDTAFRDPEAGTRLRHDRQREIVAVTAFVIDQKFVAIGGDRFAITQVGKIAEDRARTEIIYQRENCSGRDLPGAPVRKGKESAAIDCGTTSVHRIARSPARVKLASQAAGTEKLNPP